MQKEPDGAAVDFFTLRESISPTFTITPSNQTSLPSLSSAISAPLREPSRCSANQSPELYNVS